MDIKGVLKNRRLALGLTLKDVAEAVGVSEATVSRWETGDIANMKRDRIEALSRVLDISPLVILGRPETTTTRTRLAKYSELFARLQELPEPEQKKAAKMIDTILTTFEE